ncbi:MAG: serine protease, partial [Verrucomicrobiota bacterium]
DYEIANGFNAGDAADAGLDTDGDGMTNLQEYKAGTDPRSNTSVLQIRSVEKSGGDIVVTFPSVLGKAYTIEQSSNLDGPWYPLTENLSGTGGLLSISDVEAADENQRRFYRAIVLP